MTGRSRQDGRVVAGGRAERNGSAFRDEVGGALGRG